MESSESLRDIISLEKGVDLEDKEAMTEVAQEILKKGNFYIGPTDSICQFDIYLDFGRGNAILKYDKSDSSGYGYKAFEGLQLMARIEEEIN